MQDAQKIFKALSNPTRLRIVVYLLQGEKCVCEIFPQIKRTQSTTSTQLKKLVDANILSSRRKGKSVYYKIKDLKVTKILKSYGVMR